MIYALIHDLQGQMVHYVDMILRRRLAVEIRYPPYFRRWPPPQVQSRRCSGFAVLFLKWRGTNDRILLGACALGAARLSPGARNRTCRRDSIGSRKGDR
jgi:hypothetical protein